MTQKTAFLLYTLSAFFGWCLLNGAQSGYELKIESQTSEKLVLSFTLHNYEFKNINDSLVIVIEGAERTRCPESPDVPVLRKYILIPESGATLYVSRAEYTMAEKIRLKRRGYPLPKDYGSPPELGPCEESLEEFATIKEVGKMRSFTLALLEIHPVVETYKGIKIFRRAQLEIIYKSHLIFHEQRFYSSPFVDICRAIVLNSQALPDYNSSPIYLIIAPERYHPTLSRLIRWKSEKGYRTVFKSIEETGTTAEELKRFISDAYFTWIEPPSYILLVGDISEIPTTFTSGLFVHATDLYFATVDGEDFIPDILLGRISVSDTIELHGIVEKILQYEKANFSEWHWLKVPSFAACGEDGLYDIAEGTHRYAIENYFHPTRFEPETLFARLGATGENILEGLNEGREILNYSGHGGPQGWGNPSVNSSDLISLTNAGKYPLVISNACLTGKFDDPVCFGEVWIRLTNAGAIAFIGATNSTYWVEDDIWERRFYDAPFMHSLYSLGEMMLFANLELMSEGTPLDRYYFEVYNILGDPECKIYLGIPDTIVVHHQPIYPSGLPHFTVETNPLRTMVSLFGDSLLCSETTEIGNVNLSPRPVPTAPAELHLTVSSPAFYRPYFATLPVVYFGGLTISPESLMIGTHSLLRIYAFDSTGSPMPFVRISIAGAIDTFRTETDTSGLAEIAFTPQFGESLRTRGYLGHSGFIFYESYVSVFGGRNFGDFSIRTFVPEIGLAESADVGLPCSISVSLAQDSFFVILEHGLTRISMFSPTSNYSFAYTPAFSRDMKITIAKSGYNTISRFIPVIEAKGIFRALIEDRTTCEPVRDVLVEVFDTSGTTRIFSLRSDTNGFCSATQRIRCGRYLAVLSRFGYETSRQIFWLPLNDTINFALTRLPTSTITLQITDIDGFPIPFRAYLYDTVENEPRFSAHSPYGEPRQINAFRGTYRVIVYSTGYRTICDTISVEASSDIYARRMTRCDPPVLVVNDGSRYADDIVNLLSLYNYRCEVVSDLSSLPDLNNYNLVIWLSGTNPWPVPEGAIPALLNYRKNGGKILLEGGEIVFRLTSDSLYPNLSEELLGINDWENDDAGDTLIIPQRSLSKSFCSYPEFLPYKVLPVGVSWETYYYFDIMSYFNGDVIYRTMTSELGIAFVLGHSVGLTGFAYPEAFRSREVCDKIIANMVDYLLFPFRSAGVIVGRIVDYSGASISGVSVRARILSSEYITTTDISGRFVVSEIPIGHCELSFARAGYRDTSVIVELFPDSVNEGLEVRLRALEQVEESFRPIFEIGAVFPNPFNPSATIKLNILPRSEIEVKIYDILGRAIDSEKITVSGKYEYRFVPQAFVPSGLYFIEFRSAELREVRKAIYIK